ncbi:MAG: methylated-DNA--[protein]-cysteine S-methyltransferase [Lachnospiraceae bacterium]|nr:methylated-DNA--[protein]-cysteine S-methyltransferase [Lachnospiraceae bacterium]
MLDTMQYDSPIGPLLLAQKHGFLVGLWLEGQKYYLGSWQGESRKDGDSEILRRAKGWLDRYFRGERPDVRELALAPKGSGFQKEVWEILCKIPYGKTVTYGEIAREIAARRGLESMSPQAVGGAVGHNPISIIIPCHRVVGANGSLTGYAGGLDKKMQLLKLERADIGKP